MQPRLLLKFEKLQVCRIRGRINRFLVEVEKGGEILLAHLANSGRLEQFLNPGTLCLCLPQERPAKSQLRLIASGEGEYWSILDTRTHMLSFEKALESELIPWLEGWKLKGRNARLGNSLIDYLLQKSDQELFLEIKGAVMHAGELALYPDAPSLRGKKHIQALMDHARKGGGSAMLFISSLPEVRAFSPHEKVDPQIALLLRQAQNQGVIIRAINLVLDSRNWEVLLLNPDLRVCLGSQNYFMC